MSDNAEYNIPLVFFNLFKQLKIRNYKSNPKNMCERKLSALQLLINKLLIIHNKSFNVHKKMSNNTDWGTISGILAGRTSSEFDTFVTDHFKFDVPNGNICFQQDGAPSHIAGPVDVWISGCSVSRLLDW